MRHIVACYFMDYCSNARYLTRDDPSSTLLQRLTYTVASSRPRYLPVIQIIDMRSIPYSMFERLLHELYRSASLDRYSSAFCRLLHSISCTASHCLATPQSKGINPLLVDCCMNYTELPCSATLQSAGIHPLHVALVGHARGGNGRRGSVPRRKPEPRLHALGRYCIPEVSVVGLARLRRKCASRLLLRASVGREDTVTSMLAAPTHSRATVLLLMWIQDKSSLL